jgi:hypothetical protein
MTSLNSLKTIYQDDNILNQIELTCWICNLNHENIIII